MLDPKTLLESPKKIRITVICSLVALLTLGTIIMYLAYVPGADVPPAQSEAVSDAPDEPETPGESDAPSQILVGTVPNLTIDEARGLALADAGVAESEAQVSREALAQDNGVWVYEFRFRTEAAQYEYKLNANTGEVRSLVKEIYSNPSAGESELPAFENPPSEQPAQPQPAQSSAPSVSPPQASTPAPAPAQSSSLYIGVDRAKAIALEHAGLSADQVTFTHASMDREHNTMVYEIEFRQGRTEYEYEIDASSGSILSYERDGASAASAAPVPAPSAPESFAPVSAIDAEQAKAIALEHAGLSASEVTFTHAQLHQDHGTMVYEIEFRQDRAEFEYEIDAFSGSILDYERDTH